MRGRGIALASAAGLLLAALPAGAETLRDALLRAYKDNPTITASRAQQRATDENVPIAKAAGRPQLTTQTQYTQSALRTGNSLTNPTRQFTAFGGVTVPIYSGGAVKNAVRAAETRVAAGQAGLRSTEATTFTDVVAAYNNVIRDEAIVGLNQQNVRVLETNLRASRDRFQVGDLTRTDVAQSEARLSLARAQLQSAEATLVGSREDYVRLVGVAPGTLADAPPLPNLPGSPDAAVEVALRDNPALLSARKSKDATEFDIRVARASRLPQFGLSVGEQYNNFLGSLGAGQGFSTRQSGAATTAGVTFNLPFFQGGAPAARVRQAQALRSQAIEQETETERQVIATTRSAYASWRSSLEVIASSEAGVSANKLSLEGVRAENSVGTRTILDILNAEQELLNSQVILVTARRDAYVAGFALLAAMGQAEAQDLGLDGGPLYDPATNYNRVKNRISDFADDKAPQPVAPGTQNVPAQSAVVAKPLDPMLKSNVDRNTPLTTGSEAPSRQR